MAQNEYGNQNDRVSQKKGTLEIDTLNILMANHNLMASQFKAMTKQLMEAQSKQQASEVARCEAGIKPYKQGEGLSKDAT